MGVVMGGGSVMGVVTGGGSVMGVVMGVVRCMSAYAESMANKWG